MLKTELKNQLDTIWQGLKDTIPSLKTLIVFTQPAIRSTLKNILIINGIAILTTTLYEFSVFPLIKQLVGEGAVYQFFAYLQFVAWTIPFGLICTALNIYYWQNISQDVPGGLKIPIEPPDPNENFMDSLKKILRDISIIANNSLFRILLLPGLAVQAFVFSKIPWLTYPIQIISGSLMNAFYAFEYDWNKAGLTLDQQTAFFEKNWTYFLGFGLPLTLILHLSPTLYVVPIFAMLLPIFVILSSQSTIFAYQTTTTYRLPYFGFAKILPTLVTCMCKRKLKNLPDAPQPTQTPLATQHNKSHHPFNMSFPSDLKEENSEPYKKPILHSNSLTRKTHQAFLSEDEEKARRHEPKRLTTLPNGLNS
jgi:hypothetical protein